MKKGISFRCTYSRVGIEEQKSHTNKDISKRAEHEPSRAYAQGPQIHFTTVIVLNRGYIL